MFYSMESAKPKGKFFKYIDVAAVDNKTNTYYPRTIESCHAPSRASRRTQRGDILFSMVRPYLRNITLVQEDDCIASTGFFVCRPRYANSEYCFYMMLTKYVVDGLNQYMKGDNSPSINNDNIESFLFPLPPINEQIRIVKRVKEILEILDLITADL